MFSTTNSPLFFLFSFNSCKVSGRTKDDRLGLSFKPQIFEEAALMLGATAITLKYAGALDPLLKDSTFLAVMMFIVGRLYSACRSRC